MLLEASIANNRKIRCSVDGFLPRVSHDSQPPPTFGRSPRCFPIYHTRALKIWFSYSSCFTLYGHHHVLGKGLLSHHYQLYQTISCHLRLLYSMWNHNPPPPFHGPLPPRYYRHCTEEVELDLPPPQLPHSLLQRWNQALTPLQTSPTLRPPEGQISQRAR